MSLLSKYALLEAQRKQIEEQMRALESNKEMKVELEFKTDLEKVMKKHNKTASDVVELLNPLDTKHKIVPKTVRRPRKTKIYKNPETGEVVETKGGNNKILREWKDEYGAETVESWLLTPENQAAQNQEPAEVE